MWRAPLPMLTLAACATAPASDDGYFLSTNEPFRSVRIEGARARVSSPEIAGRDYALVGPNGSASSGLRWTGIAGGSRLELRVTPGRCEDSMSGAAYPYSATITIDGSAADGCARRLSDPPPTPPE